MKTEHPLGDAESIGVENLPNHPRRWWAATILSLLTPGLGQLYNGEAKKGILFFGFALIAGIALLLFMMGFPTIVPINVIFPLLGYLAILIYILKDAIATARNHRITYQRKSCNKWYLYVGIMIIAAFVISPAIKYTIAEAYRIPSGAMEPTLLVGDYMLASKTIYRFKNPSGGDIVVFKYPGDGKTNYVKRLIATPGQTVEIRNKKVFVDGREIPFPALASEGDTGPILPHYPAGPHAPFTFNPFDETTAYNRDNFGPYKVPPDSFFVMGDNRDNSFDSPFWGPVPNRLLIGKAVITHWSRDRDHQQTRWERIGQAIH